MNAYINIAHKYINDEEDDDNTGLPHSYQIQISLNTLLNNDQNGI
jgi:hypothetical protein